MQWDVFVDGRRGRLVRAAAVMLFISLGVLLLGQSRAFAAEEWKIEVVRDQVTDKATFGKMKVDGEELCHTLEPPPGGGPEGKGPIPEGTYTGRLRYDHEDQWRIELNDVPKFKNVQIHIGNYPKDTKGCILVGKDRDAQHAAVTSSKDAYKALKKAFYGTDEPNSTPNKKIVVAITSANK